LIGGPFAGRRRPLASAVLTRHDRSVEMPDEDGESIFVITVYDLQGEAKKAFRRRQR
jgi:hypothetical protein